MTGFDDNVAVMDEWLPSSPNPRTIFTAMSGQEENSKPVLEIELSLNHGYVKEDCLQSNNLPFGEEKPGLGERIASRAGGFHTPKLNIDSIPSPCLTISSPGLSPATLLESPVFLSNPLAPTSPTTGKFSFFPGGNSYMSPSDPSDKTKDELFDDIDASFTFHPVSRSSSSIIPGNIARQSFPSTEISINYGNCNTSQTMAGVELGSQDVETVNLHGKFPGTSAEIHNSGKDVDPGEVRTLDDAQDEEQRRKGGDLVVAGGAPAEDGYNWRKYGQKLVKGSEYPRSYYKCTHPNCLVTKKVERSREGHVTEIIYKGAHNHPKPPPNRRAAAIGSSGTSLLDLQIDGTEQSEQQQSNMGRDDSPWLVAQQAGTNNENGEETSPDSTTGFESGQMQVHGGTHQYDDDDDDDGDGAPSAFSNDEDEDDDHVMHGSEGDEPESKRRKLEEAYAEEMSGATRAIREPRVVVQTTSDVDILDDGYRWRKYGQKVVKGNPNPRSYYKCTGPGCLVRKHVERASHDFKSVITSYDGKHNHDVPMARNSSNHGGPGGSSAQTQVHQPEPRSRFERPVTSNPPFVRPFSFQPRLGPPPPGGFSFACLGQTGLHNLAMPSFPVHPYMAGTSQQAVGEPGLMMLPTRSTDPKVEPVSDTGLVGLSGSSSIYRQFMSRLPQI